MKSKDIVANKLKEIADRAKSVTNAKIQSSELDEQVLNKSVWEDSV